MLHNKIDDENKDGTDKEIGMLILAACFHDIGMSYREEDKEDLLDNLEFKKYLENNHSEYIKVYGGESQEISDEICCNFFRSNHHVHIYDVMEEAPWDEVLNGKIAQEDLILVCKSHGEDSSYLNELEADVDLDLRMCAVLLRLADILDFDTSRAPKAVYAYCGFTGSCSGEKDIAKMSGRNIFHRMGLTLNMLIEKNHMNFHIVQIVKIYKWNKPFSVIWIG